MFRNFASAAILCLTASIPAAADSLSQRVHTAAVAACAPESSLSRPASHYGAITEHCIARVSDAAMSRLEARALDRTQSTTAALSH